MGMEIDSNDLKFGFSIYNIPKDDEDKWGRAITDDFLISTEMVDNAYEDLYSSKDYRTFQEKMTDAMEGALIVFDEYIVNPESWIKFIDAKVQNSRIAWSSDQALNYEIINGNNKEVNDLQKKLLALDAEPDFVKKPIEDKLNALYKEGIDNGLAKDLMQEAIKAISYNSRISKHRETMMKVWGEHFPRRWEWLLKNVNDHQASMKSGEMISAIFNKLKKSNISFAGLEKTIPSVIGLLYNKPATLPENCWFLYTGDETKDLEIYNRVRKATQKFLWWSLVEKMKFENQTESKEPLDLIQEEEAKGVQYTKDYDEMERDERDGNNEKSFNQCFNTFTFNDKTGEEQQVFYKNPSKTEYDKSLALATKLGNLVLGYFNDGYSLETTRPSKRINPDNYTVLDFLMAKQGRRYKQQIEDFRYHNGVEEVEEKIYKKVFTEKKLIDLHANRLMDLFWGLWRDQVDKGLIKKKPKLDNII